MADYTIPVYLKPILEDDTPIGELLIPAKDMAETANGEDVMSQSLLRINNHAVDHLTGIMITSGAFVLNFNTTDRDRVVAELELAL